MAKKQKFYVVWEGHKTGIFNSWDQCKSQIEGYPAAKYKSFDSWQQAEQAYKGAYVDYVKPTKPEVPAPPGEDQLRRIGKPISESYCVDAACSGNPGALEYKCVHTGTGKEIFKQGPHENGTNNIGEFLAIVHALALFKREKITAPIYSDSETALAWIGSRKCRTKLAQMESNAKLFELIERAETWLLENDYENRVLKWITEVWGEIPADFGRK